MEILSQDSRRNSLASRWCALLLMVGILASTAQEPASEYQVKAAFLVNFPKYMDWPPEAFAETNSPIVIAILGETRVTEEIQKVILGRMVNGRTMVLKRLVPGEDSAVFHILFISAAEQPRAADRISKLKLGVLTVGESDDFLASGGIINLSRRAQKVALDINLTAANSAGLKISSKLLTVATVVKGKSK